MPQPNLIQNLPATPAQPAPPETKPTTSPVAEPQASVRDVDKLIDDTLASLGYSTKPKPSSTQEPAGEPIQEPVKEPAPVAGQSDPAPAPEKKARIKVKARQAREESHDFVPEIRQVVADEIARATRPVQTPNQPSNQLDLHPDHREELDVLRELEKSNPVKYAGISDKYVRGLDQVRRYQAEWERDNPGEDFALEDHEDAIGRYLPKYVESDFTKAQARLEVRRELQQERDRENQAQRMRQGMENAERSSQASQQQFLNDVNPDLAQALAREGVEKGYEMDPIAMAVITPKMAELSRFVRELELISHGKPIDVRSNETHSALNSYMSAMENGIKNLTSGNLEDLTGNLNAYTKSQKYSGKFASHLEYDELPASLKSRYWRLDADALKYILTADYAHQAKADIKKIRESVERSGKMARPTVPNQSGPSAASPAPAIEKPRSPSTASGADTVTNAKPGADAYSSLEEKVVASLW